MLTDWELLGHGFQKNVYHARLSAELVGAELVGAELGGAQLGGAGEHVIVKSARDPAHTEALRDEVVFLESSPGEKRKRDPVEYLGMQVP